MAKFIETDIMNKQRERIKELEALTLELSGCLEEAVIGLDWYMEENPEQKSEVDYEKRKLFMETVEKANKIVSPPDQKILRMKVSDTELSTRIKNVLHGEGVVTVGELLEFRRVTLLKLPNLGWKSYQEILRFLDKNGLGLSIT